MKKLCIVCRINKPNISLNLNSYCSKCFMYQMENKMSKMVRGCNPKSKIIIFLKDSPSSVLFLRLIIKAFKSKNIIAYVEIVCSANFYHKNINNGSKSVNNTENIYKNDSLYNKNTNKNPEVEKQVGRIINETLHLKIGEKFNKDKYDPTEDKYDYIKNCDFNVKFFDEISTEFSDEANNSYNLPLNIIKYAKDNGFSTIYFQNVSELIATRFIYFFSKENSNIKKEIKFLTMSNKIDGVDIINPFQEVRMKAIVYHLYLLKIKRLETKVFFSKEEEKIYQFICNVSDNNDLAVYNIINTLKKIETD